MVALAVSSISVGIFDVKHYFNVQARRNCPPLLQSSLTMSHPACPPYFPTISSNCSISITFLRSQCTSQYWRLVTHFLAFANSSELFLAEILLYNSAVPVERQFGSVKFGVRSLYSRSYSISAYCQSFVVVSILISIILEFVSLLLLHRLGLNIIAPGPSTLLYATLYQHSRIVPSVYNFRVFGVPLTNKSFTYFLALQVSTFSLYLLSHSRPTACYWEPALVTFGCPNWSHSRTTLPLRPYQYEGIPSATVPRP